MRPLYSPYCRRRTIWMKRLCKLTGYPGPLRRRWERLDSEDHQLWVQQNPEFVAKLDAMYPLIEERFRRADGPHD